MLKEMAKYQE